MIFSVRATFVARTHRRVKLAFGQPLERIPARSSPRRRCTTPPRGPVAESTIVSERHKTQLLWPLLLLVQHYFSHTRLRGLAMLTSPNALSPVTVVVTAAALTGTLLAQAPQAPAPPP